MNKQVLVIGFFGLAVFVDLILWSSDWRNNIKEPITVIQSTPQCNCSFTCDCNCTCLAPPPVILQPTKSLFINDEKPRYVPARKTTATSLAHFSYGIPIEELTPYLRSPVWYNDPKNNPDLIGDLSHIHFLPNYINVNAFPRRIYFDLGVNTFESSIGWMLSNYPCKFDYIYGWEASKKFEKTAQPPPEIIEKYGNIFDIQVGVYVDVKSYTDNNGIPHINLVDFVVTHCKKEDYVALKMDVEGFEWNVIPYLIETGTFDYIDEFFVEIHFDHPLMRPSGWQIFAPHTAEEARALLASLRELGVYAHYWP